MNHPRYIKGYESLYRVYRNGDIESLRYGKVKKLKKALNKNGYIESVLVDSQGKRKNEKWHRLVATAFIVNPQRKPFVNHKNGITTDNRVSNLEWCTAKENYDHARFVIKTMKFNPKGVLPKGLDPKLKPDQVIDIKKRINNGDIGRRIAEFYHVSDQTVYDIKNGRCWSWLKPGTSSIQRSTSESQ